EPVLGVAEIRLAAMHQAMPVTAGYRGDVLTEPVGFLQEIVIEPQTRQAGSGHVRLENLGWRKRRLGGQAREHRPGGLVGTTGTEGMETLFAEQFRDPRGIRRGVMHRR